MTTPDTLRQWMERHGLVQGDVALMCGVSDRSVRSWVSGQHAIPQSVTLLMQAVDDGKVDLGWLAETISKIGKRAA